MSAVIEIFCCYARKDQLFLEKIKAALSPLRRQDLITIWDDTNINAGEEWEESIHKHLNQAHIILLLISPDFLASDYCYSKEMYRALQRHERREASVIPVILRPVHWQGTPFGKLQALPREGKPVINWRNQDEAFFDIVEGLRKVMSNIPLQAQQPGQQNMVAIPSIDSPLAKSLLTKDITVFCCHARRDKPYLNYLMTHMAPVRRICNWQAMGIRPENTEELNKYLQTAQIIFPMLSADFLWEDYVYSEAMLKAIKRHERREASVIPIYLSPVAYHGSPFDGLQMLPSNGKPLMAWRSLEEALVEVVVGIRNAIKQITTS